MSSGGFAAAHLFLCCDDPGSDLFKEHAARVALSKLMSGLQYLSFMIKWTMSVIVVEERSLEAELRPVPLTHNMSINPNINPYLGARDCHLM